MPNEFLGAPLPFRIVLGIVAEVRPAAFGFIDFVAATAGWIEANKRTETTRRMRCERFTFPPKGMKCLETQCEKPL